MKINDDFGVLPDMKRMLRKCSDATGRMVRGRRKRGVRRVLVYIFFCFDKVGMCGGSRVAGDCVKRGNG